ncbi:hypothetical protein SDJN02_25607, partial [Cucurbita argyrosperma subsp. argyrosperma]
MEYVDLDALIVFSSAYSTEAYIIDVALFALLNQQQQQQQQQFFSNQVSTGDFEQRSEHKRSKNSSFDRLGAHMLRETGAFDTVHRQ